MSHLDATGPWLIAFKGEAGSGKSTLSRALSRRLRWPLIDKDDARDLVDDANPGLAYDLMFSMVRRQLLQGLSVICDSPLSYQRGYDHARAIADETHARLVIVECHCSDESVWRERIDGRKRLDLPSHHQTDWETMRARSMAGSDPAHYPINHPLLVVETLRPVDDLCAEVAAWLEQQAANAYARE